MYNSNILDPIHGIIKVSEIEKWIFGQKLFNRLRRIKQNTFLYLVFPSANHTRFEHSIGVMHLAHQIYANAQENYSSGIFKKNKYKLKETTGFNFFSVQESLQKEEALYIQELRIAALLHDVGHGPMSHLFDHYTISGEQFFKILNEDTDLKIFENNFRNLIKDKSKKIEHEVVSCLFIIKIINHLKKINLRYPTKFHPDQKAIIEQLNLKRIIQMVEPDFNTESVLIVDGRDYSDFFCSIISSFPLDADRMDYLLRDSYFAGVNYGLYDKSRLLMSFIPVIKDDKVMLAIKESGVDSVIRFIQSRTHLYNQVYFHKTNRAANIMLDYACKKLIDSTPINNSDSYGQFAEFYWNNSDELFLWNTLLDRIDDKNDKKLLNDLLERNLVKRIFQHKITIVNASKEIVFEFYNQLKKVVEELELASVGLEDNILIDSFPNRVFKDVEKSKLKIVSKRKDEYFLEADWKGFNQELEILDHEVVMFRIYLRGKFDSREIFNEKKQAILDKLKPILEKLPN